LKLDKGASCFLPRLNIVGLARKPNTCPTERSYRNPSEREEVLKFFEYAKQK